MKARNPNTGNLETIYVKALDSLPVGSEIDIEDGSDIPVGWEEVEDYDTGWITLPNTDYNSVISYRKIGNIVSFTATITTTFTLANHTFITLGTLPEEVRPITSFFVVPIISNSSMNEITTATCRILSSDGNIQIRQSTGSSLTVPQVLVSGIYII